MSADIGTEFGIPEGILESIFDAAAGATHWSNVLGQIAEWVAAAGAAYFLLDTASAQPRVTTLYSSGFTRAAEAAYHDAGCMVDPHMRLGAETPLRKWFFSEEHFDNNFISRDPFFQEVMNPQGIRWIAGSRLWSNDENIACLAVHKPIETAGFSTEERLRLNALAPHFNRATRLHKRLNGLALKAEVGIEALNRLSSGIAVLNQGRGVVFANREAERLLQHRAIFKLQAGNRLSVVHARSDASLRNAVADALRYRSTALQVCDRDARPAIRVVVLPLPPRSDLNAWQEPLALLTMNDLQKTPSIPGEWLHQLFGLTATESKVANWLIGGRTIEQYAEQHGVSVETARSQLKAIFSKSGTRTQAQLVAALTKTPFGQSDFEQCR